MIDEGRMNLDASGLKKELSKRGWKLKRQGTEHDLYSHEKSDKVIAVPRHKGAIPMGTVHSILSKSASIRESKETITPSKLFSILEDIDKKEKMKKIVLNKNKSKVIIHPPLKEGEEYVLTATERMKAVYFPEGIIADPNARPELKDYAFAILQLRKEDY